MAITYPETIEVLIDGVTVANGATATSAVFSFPDNALIIKAELYVTVAGWASAPGG